MRAALALSAGVLAGSVLGQAAPVALAAFTESASASASFRADVLAPPTGVAVSAPFCGASGHAVTVSWKASTSGWLDGYEVALATSSGGPYSVVAPASSDPTATSRVVDGLARRTTYYVVVRTTRDGWRAPSDVVSVTTPQRVCV